MTALKQIKSIGAGSSYLLQGAGGDVGCPLSHLRGRDAGLSLGRAPAVTGSQLPPLC